MQFTNEVMVFGVKASKGTLENGTPYDSTVFHIEADLKQNSAGEAIGKCTTPFKCGSAAEFEKWKHFASSFPLKAKATFEIAANGKGAGGFELVAIQPMERAKAA